MNSPRELGSTLLAITLTVRLQFETERPGQTFLSWRLRLQNMLRLHFNDAQRPKSLSALYARR